MSRSASYIAIGLSAWVLCICWALSSPVGSAPDDDYHLTSIYCLSGDESLCRDVDGAQGEVVEVPDALLLSHVCYYFVSEQSAACTQELQDGAVTRTERYNHSGDYPPTFYAAMSPFAGSDITRSVLVMRCVALSVALLVLGLSAASNPRMRDSQLLAWCFVSIPLGMFLLASTNPSGWALAGVAAIWPPAHAMFHAQDRRWFAFAVAVSTLALLLATSRRDSAGMAAGVLGLAVIAYARDRRQRPALIVVAIQVVLLAAVLLGFNSNNETETQEQTTPPGALWSRLLHLPAYWAGIFGNEHGGLGWLDTRMPGLVWVPALASVAALGLLGIRILRTDRVVVLTGIAFALVAYPLLALRSSDPADGFWFQPRYCLPLLFVFLGVALSPIDGVRWHLTRPQRWILAASAMVATSIAMHVQLRRYVTGTDVSSFDLNASAEWTPSGPLNPMAFWLLATVMGAVLFACLLPLFRPQAQNFQVAGQRADDHAVAVDRARAP